MKRLLLLLLIFISACNEETNDTNRPPTSFTVTINHTGNSTANLSWTPSQDPEGGEIKYDVYLNEVKVKDHILENVCDLTDLSKNTAYTGKVVAFDILDNSTESDFSLTTGDAGPSAFTVNIEEITNQTALVKWTPSLDPEGTQVKYSIYLYSTNKLIVSDLTSLEYRLTGLQRGGIYLGKVVAEGNDNRKTEQEFLFATPNIFSHAQAIYNFCGGDTGDQTIGQHHGEIVGSVTSAVGRKGIPGCAFEFPGTNTDYIEIPFSEYFNIPAEGSFSISLWYQGGTEDDGDLEYFFVKENPDKGSDYHVGLYDCNNVTFGSEYSPVAFGQIHDCSDPADPIWHHVVAVYKNKIWSLYVDGVRLAYEESDYGISQSSNGIKMGKRFRGKLADIIFFSTALIEEDVLTLFNL